MIMNMYVYIVCICEQVSGEIEFGHHRCTLWNNRQRRGGGGRRQQQQSKTYRYLRDRTAYLLQHDILHPLETAREAIESSALLRLRGMKNDEKLRRVREIMNSLELGRDVEDMLIGDTSMRGLSGGEKKRVSIGIELVNDPDVLILDEPTTGLGMYTTVLHII